MKAKELMIGDWVLSLFNKPIKIDPYKWVLDEQKKENEVIGFRFNDLSPIPLTEEILKANGFEEENGFQSPNYTLVVDDKCIWWSRTIGMSITKHPNEKNLYSPYVCIPKCTYVHELQHALRLCGLNDLADNFKVGGEE